MMRLPRLPRWAIVSLALVATTGFAARMYAPTFLQRQINQAIEEAPGVEGQVGNIDIALWRGAYQIHEIQLYSIGVDEKVPLLITDKLDLSVLWSALFRGQIVSEMHFVRPQIHLRDTPDRAPIENEDVKEKETWIDLAHKLVPFEIDKVDIESGVIKFELAAGKERNLLSLTGVNGSVKNITNIREKRREDFATADFEGTIQNEAKIVFHGSYNPFEASPTFDTDVEMQRLDVRYLDAFIKHYLPVDFEAGELDMAMELKANKGNVEGYVKVGVYDLDVFSWKQDVAKDGDNPFNLLFEALTGGLSGFLENDNTDMVATRIPVNGEINDPQVPTLDAIAGLFRNALIEAYDMDVEELFSFSDSAPANKEDK
ncbi:DUF748 domain-containing protein [Alteromonas halophila]|uniref:DUF748 domain-containing protein n=1 Tax=Alteromonas halophila TaxID=516698 RepID=A0A918JPK3_9ALTE|nr:DUF748 domain-containing protein [Alteromonas halophila]GGW93361.1 hypothetical protein GCM10007391_29630 [Alteromonas halophila]